MAVKRREGVVSTSFVYPELYHKILLIIIACKLFEWDFRDSTVYNFWIIGRCVCHYCVIEHSGGMQSVPHFTLPLVLDFGFYGFGQTFFHPEIEFQAALIGQG